MDFPRNAMTLVKEWRSDSGDNVPESPRVAPSVDQSVLSDDDPLDMAKGEWTTRPRLLGGEPLFLPLQWYIPPRRPYTRRELLADRIVNFSGMIFAWIATPILGYASYKAGDDTSTQLAFWAHGFGLITMLTCSALYHYWAWQWSKSHNLLSLDYIGISAMIMGSYAPMMVICGCSRILAFVWAVGLMCWSIEAYKLVVGPGQVGGGPGKWGKMDIFQVVCYLVMGWACLPVMPTLIRMLPIPVMLLSVVGGVLYTSGVGFLVSGQLEHHMPIWHSFVLAASLCFYCSNLFFLVGLGSKAV